MSKIIGYTRVSSDKQTTDNQKHIMLDLLIESRIYKEYTAESVRIATNEIVALFG